MKVVPAARHKLLGKISAASLALVLVPLFSLPLSAQVDLNRVLSQGMAAYKEKNYEKAIESLETVAKAKDGATASVLYTLGFSQYFLLRHQDAADTFLAYLKKYPETQFTAEVNLILGRCFLEIEGKAEEALTYLGKAAASPEFTEEARFLAADAYIKKGDTEKAASTLKTAMGAKSSGPTVLRAALQLVDLYIADGKFDEAIGMLRQLEDSPGYPDVIVTVNNRFVQIGDAQLEAQKYPAALEAYSSVRPRTQVIGIQVDRLEQMRDLKKSFESRVAALTKAKEPVPRSLEEKIAVLTAMIENTDKVLGQLRTVEGYDATIHYRVARCYFNMDRFWPASVGFESVAEENPKSEDAATALFGAIVSQWRLERPAAARKLCDTYLERYPEGQHFAQVAELSATLLQQQKLHDEAIAFLGPFLEKHPNLESRQKLLTLLANSRFESGKYDAAAADYDTLRKEFAASTEFQQEYTYRRALCDFLRNDYEATIKSFDSYEREYPIGDYLPDIRYRRGIIQLALKDFDNLIAGMNDLLKNPDAKPFAGQIHTLLGDAYLGKNDDAAAATEYASALRTANGDNNVIEYSLEQATNLLRGSRRWAELEALWTDFLAKNPDHPMALRGVAELSKLLVRAKKTDEARKLLAGRVLSEIHNTRSEYVEMLISQLANLYVPPRTVKKDAPKPDVEKIEAELMAVLEVPEASRTSASLARSLFAKSELARMMNDAARRDRNLNAIANNSSPEDLGPILLSMIGQFLFDTGEYDKAVPLFTRLRDAFPESVFSDAAPVGLGQIALAKKDYEGALEQFEYAITRSAGGSMLKEATFGKAVALKGLNRSQNARKLFEEVVSAQDWRGLEKAGALFELGEIAADSGDEGTANAYFQRVYLSHMAFPDYASRAYLRSADMLEADGQVDAAKDTLRKLIRDPKLKDTPAAKEARKRLNE